MPEPGVLLLLALLPLVAPVLVRWRVPGFRTVAAHWIVLEVLGGAAVAMFVVYVERVTIMVLGGTSDPTSAGAALVQVRHLVLLTPLAQAILVLVVLPLRRRRLLQGPRDAMLCAVSAGAGYSTTESFIVLLETHASALGIVQTLVAIPAALFCTGVWGYFLGLPGPRSWRGFTFAWCGGLLLKALYDHLLFDLGPGYKAALLPLVLFVGAGSYLGFRASVDSEMPSSSGRPLLSGVGHVPTLDDVREALRPTGHRVRVTWMLLGVFVVLGVTIVALSGAVIVGQRLGFDFSRAAEADLHANPPLLLAGLAVIVAFPVSGYLIALASGTDSTIEVAMASGLAILGAAGVLSMTEPLALVFVFAVSPVAFSLACAAGWWVARRQRPKEPAENPVSS